MNTRKKYIYIFLFAIFIVLMHIYIQPIFGDEVHFRAKLISYDYDLISLLKWRYGHWSSRLILEFPMYILATISPIFWKIFDCICFLALFYIMSLYTDQSLFLLASICTYPLMHLASAGWIATTTNYLWPFTIGWIAFILFSRMVSKTVLKPYSIFGYSLLLLYAGNSELISCLFLLAIILFLIYDHLFCDHSMVKQKGFVLWSLILSVIGIINVFICPGNQERITKEITKWMPEYPHLSFFRKLQLCVVSTIQHFTSIPNVIFLLLGFLVAVIVIMEKRFSILQKIISVIPFAISFLLTMYYGYFEILKKHNLNYVLPSVSVKSGSSEAHMQQLLFLFAVIYLICMLISIFSIFCDDDITCLETQKYKNSFCFVSIYFGGLISRFTLLFSPTMLASGTRIYFIFYMAQILILNKLFEKIKNKSLRTLCYAICIVGIVINIVMVYMLQKKYC